MNTLNGQGQTLVYSLSGLSTGTFDELQTNNITSNKYNTSIPSQNILYLDGLTGNVQQQINNINSTSGIDTSDLATLSTNQNIIGVKSFSGTQIFSSIQLNSDLILNNGGTITNS